MKEEKHIPANYWPPDAGDPRIPQAFFAFRWDPDELLGVSGQIFDLHCCLIFQRLSQTRGTASSIDLYAWHWEAEIKKFCEKVLQIPRQSEMPMGSVRNKPEIHPGDLFAALTPEKRKAAHDWMKESKIPAGDAAALAALDASQALENMYRHEPWIKIGDFCPKPPVVYGDLLISGSSTLRKHPALWWRLQRWWGWYGSSLPEPPLCHMQKIIEENLESLLTEQYISEKGALHSGETKYELTSLGFDKLNYTIPNTGGTFKDLINRPDFISSSIQVITSVCQAVFAK